MIGTWYNILLPISKVRPGQWYRLLVGRERKIILLSYDENIAKVYMEIAKMIIEMIQICPIPLQHNSQIPN